MVRFIGGGEQFGYAMIFVSVYLRNCVSSTPVRSGTGGLSGLGTFLIRLTMGFTHGYCCLSPARLVRRAFGLDFTFIMRCK
jgi:hypothetical protein